MLANFVTNPVQDVNRLVEVEKFFGHPLPLDYRCFMTEQDGGEGFVGDQYLVLWRASELVEFNCEYETAKYAPGLILFGSDGGGEAFAFDTRYSSVKIVMVPFIGLSLKDTKTVADSFGSFLFYLAYGEHP